MADTPCEVCGRLVRDEDVYIDDFFGGRVHASCLVAVETEDEEDERE